MILFGKAKALVQQLKNDIAEQNEKILQLNETNEHLKKHYEEELEKLRASMPKEQKDFEKLADRSKNLEDQIEAYEEKLQQIEGQISQKESIINTKEEELNSLSEKCNDKASEFRNIADKVNKAGILYSAYSAANRKYEKSEDGILEHIPEDLMPVVQIELNCMNVKELRKLYNQYQSNIRKTFRRYEGRYTTKSNIAIYKLMVIAMEAELQNILHSLSYGKLEKAIDNVRAIINRYYEVAVAGNQSIASSLKNFIAEIEDMFIGAVKVEYEYYVKKEQIKEEQRALREQMRQEEEERKALEIERKKIEKEESKYTAEIEQLTERAKNTEDDEQVRILIDRIKQLQEQLADVQKKKDDIINLQNGKAGYVYVISNLGSFGDSVFKVGMTRRLEPMDRIKELSNASVPFSFDVHSFIFSDDAVGLEKMLHDELNSRRVNKVNLRKEFFNASIDEIEKLVLSHYPSAEFKKTMLAEQYYQSQSLDSPLMQADPDEEDE